MAVPAVRNEEAVSRFVERFAAQLTEAGMQRMAARVFAQLLASDEGSMTSAELGEALQISPAAVSGAVSYLTQVNMVSREREPGSRRDRYVLHNELWYETFTRRDQVLTLWEKTLREGAAGLGSDSCGQYAHRRDGRVLRVHAGRAAGHDGPLADPQGDPGPRLGTAAQGAGAPGAGDRGAQLPARPPVGERVTHLCVARHRGSVRVHAPGCRFHVRRRTGPVTAASAR